MKDKLINFLYIFLPLIIALSILIYFIDFKKKEIKQMKEDSGYFVEMSPVGNVKFKKVPTKILTVQETYNDILVSFDKENGIAAVGSIDKFFDDFYKDLNIVPKINKENIIQIAVGRNMYDKELFYSLNADIHHIDPIALSFTKGWKPSDITEISNNIGPFFANRYSIENKKPSHLKDYKFYTLEELTLKFGEVYKKEETAKKLNEFTKNLIKNIQNKLPKNNEKTIAIVYLCRKGIVPFDSESDGYGLSQYKILKCKDAFKLKGIKTYSYEGNFGTMLDKETLLLANPDIIIINEGIYINDKYKFFSKRTKILINEFEKFKKDPLLKDIPAFKNNKIILGGIYDQGPIIRIYQLEMLAKQLYPEIFGTFRENHSYPENEQLFSRDELRKIIKYEQN